MRETYLLAEHHSADEMMVLFPGSCPFKVYMLKRPTKCGIKIHGGHYIELHLQF